MIGRRSIRLFVAVIVVLVATATSLSACSLQQNIEGIPECTETPRVPNSALVLMAQAVPTAQLLPCVRSVPVGWTFNELDARNGWAEFAFDSDREGVAALVVSLRPSCSVDGASRVVSDQPDTERYERVSRVTSGFGGERMYTFSGGCVVYTFDLQGASHAEPVTEISNALGFVSRADLATQVSEHSNGQLSLDPTE
ncbi:MAG TPA: hypothetical protein VMT88_04955 [Actinomycetes bacterium]|nr:hypothetical protein [Actinomycetes bacterium]